MYTIQPAKKEDSKQLDWCHTCSNAPRLLRSNWAKHSLTWLRSQTVTLEVKKGRSFEANLSIVCRILASLAIHPRSQHTWTSRLWWHDIMYPTSKKTFRLYEKHIRKDPMTPTNSQKQDTMSPLAKGPIDDTALERTDRHDHLVQHRYVRQHLIPDKIANPNHATNRLILTLKVKISKKKNTKIPFPSSQVLPHGLPNWSSIGSSSHHPAWEWKNPIFGHL